MNRPRKKITFFHGFVIVFILYFCVHVVIGYIHCEYSEYANCPGNEALFTDEEVTTDDKK